MQRGTPFLDGEINVFIKRKKALFPSKSFYHIYFFHSFVNSDLIAKIVMEILAENMHFFHPVGLFL